MANVMNPLEAAHALVLSEDHELISQHLASVKRVLAAYDYAHSLCGKSYFVNGVRPVECIVWSLVRQGLLSGPAKMR